MKRTTITNRAALMALLAAALCLEACSKKENELTVGVTNIQFTASGGTNSFEIKSNTSWVVSGGESWVTVVPSQGEKNATVTVQATANTAIEDRTCALTVRTVDNEIVNTVAIVQKAAEQQLQLSSEDLRLGSDEKSAESFTVTSNMPWKISDVPSWVSTSVTSGSAGVVSVKVTAKTENFSDKDRSAKITVSGGSITKTLTVVQDALLAKNCTVDADVKVSMATSFVAQLEFGSELFGYRQCFFTKKTVENYTDREIFYAVTTDGTDYVKKVDLSVGINLSPDTEYVCCYVGYNEDLRYGPLQKIIVKTKARTNTVDAPIRITSYSTYWSANTTRNDRCARYYSFYYNGYYNGGESYGDLIYDVWSTYGDSYLVYALIQGQVSSAEPYIKDNRITTYSKTAGELCLVTWGQNEQGVFSNELQVAHSSKRRYSSSETIKESGASADSVKMLRDNSANSSTEELNQLKSVRPLAIVVE